MRKAHFTAQILLIGIFLLSGIHWDSARAEFDLTSDYLCKYGLSLYKNGCLNDAIHELKKSLLVNQNNLVARQSLERIVVERLQRAGAALIPPPAPKGNNTLNIVKEQQDYLEQNRVLRDSAALKDKQINGLIRELRVQQNLLEQAEKELRGQVESLRKESQDKDARIKALQDSIKTFEETYAREKFAYEEKLRIEKSNFLAGWNQVLENKKAEIEKSQAEVAALNQQLNQQLLDKVAELNKKDNDILRLRQDVDLKSNQLKAYEEEAKGSRASNEQKLAEKDKGLAQTVSTLTVKEKELSDKGAQIKVLQDKVKEIEAVSAAGISDSKNKISELKDALSLKEKELADKAAHLAQLAQGVTEKDEQVQALRDKAKNLEDVSAAQIAQASQGLEEKESLVESLLDKIKTQEAELIAQRLESKDKIAGLEKNFALEKKQLESRSMQAEQGLIEKEAQLKDMQYKAKAMEDTIEQLKDKESSLLAEKENVVSTTSAQMAELKDAMDKLKKSLQSELDSYQAKLEIAQRGIVVTVLTDVSFDSGRAYLKPEGQRIIQKIINVLESEKKEHMVLIEGHTDNQPIKRSRWKSNWQLSCERALSVLDYILKNSRIAPGRISVAGFGEHRPISDNSTAAGRSQNRRVEIIIQPEIIKIRE